VIPLLVGIMRFDQDAEQPPGTFTVSPLFAIKMAALTSACKQLAAVWMAASDFPEHIQSSNTDKATPFRRVIFPL
jgi:hypothetical protein